MSNALKVLIGLIPVALLTTSVLANELDSTNYKLIGVSTTGGGGVVESTNYELLSSVGQISADPRNYSTNYRINQDPSAIFTAAQPTVQCFETDTDGITNCTSGPAELLSGGMVAICGTGGCYDKARFEISSSPYRYNTSTSGLISYWPMDEGAEDTCIDGEDACDRKYTNNGVASEATIVDGVYGNARRFDGINDYVDFGQDSSLDLTTQGTIAIWAKTDRAYPSDTTTTKFRGLIAKTTGGGAGQQSYFIDWYGTNSTRTLRAAIGDASTSRSATVSNFDFGNEWNLIVFTFDGSYLNLYVNGTLTAGPITQTVNAQTLAIPLLIGRAFNNQAYTWEGDLDEVSIFNRALSASEISDMWQGDTDININPPDTLYMAQISTDNFVSDIQCIDASTFRPKDISNCDINDFRTESYWETEDFNVQGLTPDTQYYIKISALHGDFTQSDFSSTASATTTAGTMLFDIDIDDAGGYTTETSSPYSILFAGTDELVAGAAATTATDLIWLDVVSSSSGGVAVIQFGTNGGLYSATTAETISSDNENLDVTGAEGFGLQSYYIDYEVSGYLGAITSTTNYSGSINTVGAVSTTANKIYDGDGPINDGRMGIYVKARAGVGRTASTDYEEEIHFILVPRY